MKVYKQTKIYFGHLLFNYDPNGFIFPIAILVDTIGIAICFGFWGLNWFWKKDPKVKLWENKEVWHDYVVGDPRFRFGMRVILGIRFDDGSRDSINGCVLFDMEKGFYLTIDHRYKNRYTENAVIEKWMKYPDYN